MKRIVAVLMFVLSQVAFAAPTITNVLVTATTATTATIQWNTSTPSSSQLMYGTDPSLPYSNNVVGTLVTSHTMTLQLLSAGPLYYVAAVSADGSGSTQSSQITFALCGAPLAPVQGTVTNYYQYGSYTLTWVPPTGASQSPTICGQAVQQTVTGKLDGGASFNTQVADASKVVPGPGQWEVQVTDAGNIAPLTIYAYLSQVTQNVSAQLQAAAAGGGLQACLTNTNNSATWPSSCGGGALAAVTSINGVPGAFTFGAGAICSATTCTFPGTGVTTLNGLNGAVTLAAGANITLQQVGNTITIVSTGGGGGGGPLGTLVNDLVTNNSSNTAAQDIYNFQATPSYSATSAIAQAVTHTGVVTLLPGSTGGFTNTNATFGVKINDLSDLGAMPRSITEQGAYCDARNTTVTFTAGSKTVLIYNDFFYPGDTGKILTTVGSVGGVPTAFETAMGAIPTASSSATMTTAAPYTLSVGTPATLAHDDTVAMAAAQNAAVANQQSGSGPYTALQIPGGACFTHAIQYKGVSMQGLNGGVSGLLGAPGEDVIQFADPSQTTPFPGFGVHLHDFSISVDERIDATKPWQLINDSGTTAEPALYRPVCIMCVWSNNPLAPGWFQGPGANSGGAYNGVASVTAGSAVICTTSATVPVVGNTIVFPYLTTVFTTTVASTAGSCGSGTARTLTSPMPTGSTASQAEWFAGTSVQTLSTAISSGSCPTTITLTNPITPNPGYESNVAKLGLVQIDSEQISYYGGTNAGNLGSQFLVVTGCAQNGTVRAGHSVGATVVPLNPYKPATPWPVSPTINSNATTPVNAAFYPAWVVGNAGIAAPVLNGNTGSSAEAFANSVVNSLSIGSYPSATPAGNTAGMYLVQLPYSTRFADLVFSGLTFGIYEGTPSFNTGGNWYNSQPTADGSSWENIRISGCNIFDFISGRAQSFRDINAYSNCYIGGNYTGAGAGFAFTSGWNDQGGFQQSSETNVDTHNLYLEPEGGALYGAIPVHEWDINIATWDNLHLGGGGETYLGGAQQTFIGGNFNQQTVFPLINYGYGNGSHESTLLFFGSNVGNTYGLNSMINYGPNAGFSGAMSAESPYAAPYGANQLGNSREPWQGQDQMQWIMGNAQAGVPFVNKESGYIPASEFNSSRSFESAPFGPWFYDATSPSFGSVPCYIDTGGGDACLAFDFNEAGIQVGPGQRLVAGKYTFTVASRSTGLASSYDILISVCSFRDTAAFNVPVTSSYSVFSTNIDMTGKNCGGDISLDFIYAAPAADTIDVGYVDFAPVAYGPTLYNLNLLNQIIINGNGGTPGYCLTAGAPDVWAPCGTANFQVAGTPLISTTTINFVGAGGTTITNPTAGEILITSTGGGGGSFSGLTGGTNTTAAMLVGTGASLGATGSGTIGATSVPFSGVGAGTNANALVIGSGGSLVVSGSGTIAATSMPFSGLSAATNVNALVIGSGGSLTYSGSGTIAASTAAALAATPTLCSSGSAPTGVIANGNATGCTAYFTGSMTANTFPIATGVNALGNSLLTLAAGNVLNWAGSGIAVTGATTPSAQSFTAGVGSLPNALPANSAGWVAPASGGTSYLIQFPGTITAGALITAAPATLYGVNVAGMSVEHIPHEFGSGFGTIGEFGNGVVVATFKATNAGTITNMHISYGGGATCTTGPTYRFYVAGTAVGSAGTGAITYQAPGVASDTPQTGVTFTAGQQVDIVSYGTVGNCAGYYYVGGTYIDP